MGKAAAQGGSNRPKNLQWSVGIFGAACVQGEVRNTGCLVERDRKPEHAVRGGSTGSRRGLMVSMKRITIVEGPRIHAASTSVRIVNRPEIRKRMNEMGMDPSSATPEELGRIVAAGITKWTMVAKAANVKSD